MSDRYQRSEAMLERALKTVPLGSQTFSKSKTQLPFGAAPYFADRAEGAYLWDVDGNKYIDFVSSLLAITLGYNDPDVKAAVAAQLEKGTIFSLASELEFEVAELICELVPCAEMVRFGKNGSDATAGAVRVARAHTGRDHVLLCGYHGWQDWYIGTTPRNLGVPKSVQDESHSFQYNNIESLEKLFAEYKDQVACVIMEPANVVAPEPGFLEAVKELTHKNGALLVFDETITGFRYSNGGAQELFGVIPDLATFGKGLANGYAISAVAGKAEYMKLMEDIFFSFTFGGETLSLAAAKAVLTKLKTTPVIQNLNDKGTYLMTETKKLIEEFNLGEALSVGGLPTWGMVMMQDYKNITTWDIRTLFIQENLKRGVYALGAHNISFAHSREDCDALLAAYRHVFGMLREGFDAGSLDAMIHCQKLEPLFKVR